MVVAMNTKKKKKKSIKDEGEIMILVLESCTTPSNFIYSLFASFKSMDSSLIALLYPFYRLGLMENLLALGFLKRKFSLLVVVLDTG